MALRVSTLPAPPTLRCDCCELAVMEFLPIPSAYVDECRRRGVEHPLDAWETLSLDAYLCPHCGATDRDRLQVAFLRETFADSSGPPPPCPPPPAGQVKGGIRVLEIAPSRPVSKWLRRQVGVLYRSADLAMAHADDQVDVTDMACYPDGTFDVVICSHVLEHVPDDVQAMREIRRILRPGGVAVLLVPISNLVDGVVEDPDCVDEDERWRRFGQGDHIRIYSREGFVGRLESAGFAVKLWGSEGTLYIGRTA